MVKNPDGAWFKADERFWRTQAESPQLGNALTKKYRSKWIAVEGKNQFAKMCDLRSLLQNFLLDEHDTEDSITKGAVEKVGTLDAIRLDGGDHQQRTAIWIDVNSPHRVLKMSPTRSSGQEALFFEEFGVGVIAETPPPNDIVRLP